MGTPQGPDAAANMKAPSATKAAWRALIVLGIVQFMLIVDDAVVNVALPSIRGELGFDLAGLAWVVNGYVLAFGGLILLGGRAGDLFGHRKIFLIGLTVFALASLACGLAQEPWQLVGARFVQGAGAAMASPAALALLTLVFPEGPDRNKALGIWGGISGLGVIVGYVVSGLVTDLLSWRWVFFINLPLAAVALVVVPRLVPRGSATGQGRIDVPGAVFGTGALAALVYGLLSVPERGWQSATVIVSLVLAVVLAVAFLVTESRIRNPLVPMAFFSNRTRATSNGIMMLIACGLVGMFFLITLHLQDVLGWSPLQAGLGFVPMAVTLIIAIGTTAKLVQKVGPRGALIIGPLVVAAGLGLLTQVSPDDTYVADILPSVLLIGLGAGLTFPTVATTSMSGTTEANAGLGSAMLSVVQQIGGAVGLAILVSVASGHARSQQAAGESVAEATTSGFGLAFVVAAALLVLAALLAAFALGRAETPAPQAKEADTQSA
ncbi:MFS transporter [Microtetraspora sp. NBRC 13810]|uniref:MFS transporter n=1 Tax=Microtetraspora sp. NBRC 13810 TaxID=3030990 RepID=UPI0024A4FE2C|nr:MFS transporter [Microtetraspora sp. NBRC 13810]GLW11002.1 MFS transporter [Microtetraspora sp. NBRC 13810]